MKRHLTTETMSAYLDGEYERPADAHAHLQQCAECAQAYAAMQKLSAHVKALPEQEVTFGFQTRVMRAIENPQPAPARRIGRFLLPLGASFAAALAMVVSLSGTPTTAPTLEASGNHVLPATIDLAGALGPNGAEREPFGGYRNVQGDVQIALASAAMTSEVPGEVFRGADYNQSLFALDAGEKETLIQLLGSSVIDEHML